MLTDDYNIYAVGYLMTLSFSQTIIFLEVTSGASFLVLFVTLCEENSMRGQVFQLVKETLLPKNK